MSEAMAALAYSLPALPIWAGYALTRRSRIVRDRAILADAEGAGLTEPPSLHPRIDVDACIGCGSCVLACPEGEVLGLITGKARLIDATRCIGHGACHSACPEDAITLVFGTETRGVDIPMVDPDFQTNVPGVYIAGELGGMALIRNAIEQGRQAMASVVAAAADDPSPSDMLDVLVVGAGPAGISASLAALEAGLRVRTVEQDTLGGTVAHYPRGKIVMTAPVDLPLYGRMDFREVSKETLIALWTDVITRTGVRIDYQERVLGVAPLDVGFEVTTTAGRHRARRVVLAIGRRGTPRTLGVDGEEQTKVVYRLVEPEQYRGQAVAVVGGGDSALEAAASLAEQPGTEVTLLYRGHAFGRARKTNRERVARAQAAGSLDIRLGAEVLEIGGDDIVVTSGDEAVAIANDAVVVCAGGVLPTDFLKSAGVSIERKFGTP